MFDRIPFELRALRQWVVWRYEETDGEKPTKVPYGGVGVHADVNKPGTWLTFADAVALAPQFNGVGFVLVKGGGYTIIDLDDASGDVARGRITREEANEIVRRHTKIHSEFDSYSEVSPSGRGLHIVLKGEVPAGRRRSNVEVYSSQRYITFTGDVYNDKPIENRQDLLALLWDQIGGQVSTFNYDGDAVQKYTDAEVLNQAKGAVNGSKFETLLSGRWAEIYQSQSEADFAFIDMLAFYTQNKQQIARLFHASPLGQRDKAKRIDYLEYMIGKSFDRMLPPVDIEGAKNAVLARMAELKAPPPPQSGAAPEHLPSNHITKSPHFLQSMPPGLLGQIANFIYESSPRPVGEIALIAAIGLMAGICGRAYNVSETGLNQYLLLIAETGVGKESMAAGVAKLTNAIRAAVPTSSAFIGPSQISSGQALLKHVAKNPCFVSIVGEFGLTLKQMSAFNASSSQLTLKQTFLDLFNKSGHGNVLRKTIYSDKDKNVDEVFSPAFSLLGETNPQDFFGQLDESMIGDGLLPRFTMVEYLGPRVPFNKKHGMVEPPFVLTDTLAKLTANCQTLMHNGKVIKVQYTPEADAALDEIEIFATAQINATNANVVKHLWNRAHIRVLKLAAVMAVGVNMFEPVITLSHVEWARSLVTHNIWSLLKRFELGEVGRDSEETKQVQEVLRMVRDYLNGDVQVARNYGTPSILWEAKVIPYIYLARRLMTTSIFRKDRIGATNALQRTIKMLTDTDTLREVPKNDMSKLYRTYTRAFVLNDLSTLSPKPYTTG